MSAPGIELEELWMRFGAGIEVVFDGAPEECPVCHHDLNQLELFVDGFEFASVCCDHCGAVLAA